MLLGVSEVSHWIMMRRTSGKCNIVKLIPIGLSRFGLSVSLYVILTTQGVSLRCLWPLLRTQQLTHNHPRNE